MHCFPLKQEHNNMKPFFITFGIVIMFKYEKDSIMVVTEEEYDKCYTSLVGCVVTMIEGRG